MSNTEQEICQATDQIRFILENFGDRKLKITMIGAILGFCDRIDRLATSNRIDSSVHDHGFDPPHSN